MRIHEVEIPETRMIAETNTALLLFMSTNMAFVKMAEAAVYKAKISSQTEYSRKRLIFTEVIQGIEHLYHNKYCH